ncbi:arginase family protein [Bacillus gobiensis]|uniref:arginase family protein n=1 Tax=Bacillus gobiensis TaxID=1441095 RepID=UPI003D2406D6
MNLHTLFDKAFPGVSNGEPGGLSFRELSFLLKCILKRGPKMIDVVEFNPMS